MHKIGFGLRKIRFEKELKQDAMAQLLGLYQSDYSRIERNLKSVSEEEVGLYAQKLEVDEDALLIENESKSTYNNYGKGNHFQVIGKNYNYQISPELKQLYEDKIAWLEEKIKWLEGGK
jgi:transcriptional regulator with XRE-family HTH domain